MRAISAIAAKEEFRILVTDGHRTVNAKSLMGIFTLNMGKPLALLLDCDAEDFEAFRVKAGRFLVE